MRRKAVLEGFHVCEVCGESVYFKSWKEHHALHNVEVECIRGNSAVGMDPTEDRIESLRGVIARLEGKARPPRALLAEYRAGLPVLRKRLIIERARDRGLTSL